MTDDEKALADKAADAEKNKNISESDEDDELDLEEKDLKKLKAEVVKWRLRAKENKGAQAKAEDAEKRIKEIETRSNNTLLEVQRMQQLADKRMIDAELKSLANEFGLKKLEYARLGSGYDKLKVNADGDVEGARDMIDKLKKSDPDLFKSATTTNINFMNNVKADKATDKKKSALSMSAEDYSKAERELIKSSYR